MEPQAEVDADPQEREAQQQEQVGRTAGCTPGILRPALWHDSLMLQLLGFIIDCPDPMKLAAFYCLCRHEGVTWTDKGVAWP